MTDRTPGTAIERLIDYYKWTYVYDWEFHLRSQQLEEKIAKVQSGECTHEELFGPGRDLEEIRARLEKEMGRQLPYRIPLPAHWHWMGPDWSPRLAAVRYAATIPEPRKKS